MTTHVQRFKSWILAGGVAATTVMGALYGASLKNQSQVKKETVRNLQASPAEIVAALEERRRSLVSKQTAIEKKIEDIKLKSATTGANRGKEPRQ